MPRNTALHGRQFIAPVAAPTAHGPRGSTGSNFSTTSAKSGDSGASIATTPANQLPAPQGGIAPNKLGGPLGQTPTSAPSILALEARMKSNCSADAGVTPWPTGKDAPQAAQTAGPGRVLNFSGIQDSPVTAPAGGVPTTAALTNMVALCHCPGCNIQVMACMQCAAPMQAGPLSGGAAPEPPKTVTAFSLFKEDLVKEEVAKGTNAKAAAASASKQWAAAADTVRKEYTRKAKEANAAAAAEANMSRGKRGRDGDYSTATTPAKEKVKRPPSAYNNFNAAKRAEVSAAVKADNPDNLEGADLAKWVFKETAGRLSSMWKEMTEAEKEKYKQPLNSAPPSIAPSGDDEEVAAPVPAADAADEGPITTQDKDQSGKTDADVQEKNEEVTSEKCDEASDDAEGATPAEE